jgi:hypothetical protein
MTCIRDAIETTELSLELGGIRSSGHDSEYL